MSVNHYENFPVASILLPAPLRAPVAAIYAFARSADDFADEGDLTAAERLRRLRAYGDELDRIERGVATEHPIFQRLRPFIAEYQLPLGLFRDLLDAFSQDVVKDRYASYDELMDYCRRSANPVGRLLLHLFRQTDDESLLQSDAICSSLQLINHWQDVAVDRQKGPSGRIYLPQAELDRHGVSIAQLLEGRLNSAFRHLMADQVDRARTLMLSGAPLGRRLPGRVGLEIRAIVAGGLRILEKIEAVEYDIFMRRPTLTLLDWPTLLLNAL